MRDLKLKECLACLLEARGAIDAPVRSDCLASVVDVWTTNVSRSYGLFLFPITAIFIGLHRQAVTDRVIADSQLKDAYEADPDSDEIKAQLSPEVSRKTIQFLSALSRMGTRDITKLVHYMTHSGLGHIEELIEIGRHHHVVGITAIDALIHHGSPRIETQKAPGSRTKRKPGAYSSRTRSRRIWIYLDAAHARSGRERRRR